MRISQKFFQSIKLCPTPHYKLALQVGIHPNTLSKILHGAVRVKKDDFRIQHLGQILGLKPNEIFEASHD